MCNTKVKFSDVEFKNPIIMASGTFGFGQEYNEIYDVSILGGISSKGLTLEKREGNDGVRVWETSSGMMNSVGLQNPGVDEFIEKYLPEMQKLNTNIIVNVGGATINDYIEAVDKLNDIEMDILELNISCPNVKAGGMAFGTKAENAKEIVREIKQVTKHPLVVKLSPNAEDIVKVAEACEESGADGVSLINTVKAMAVDINKRKKVFDNTYAGLSGPAIKPIALRMVHEVSKAISIPIMGLGGIQTWQDVVEFIMVGSTCVQVGTANFINPKIGLEIVQGLENYMKKEGIKDLTQIRGII